VYARLSEARREQARQNVRPLAAALLGKGFEPLREAEVTSVRVPTLLVTGERSPALFPRLTDRLAELLPNSRRAVIPGASHSAHEVRCDRRERVPQRLTWTPTYALAFAGRPWRHWW
jgi:pimeloyl-ACP methyl ester carboxylesterase